MNDSLNFSLFFSLEKMPIWQASPHCITSAWRLYPGCHANVVAMGLIYQRIWLLQMSQGATLQNKGPHWSVSWPDIWAERFNWRRDDLGQGNKYHEVLTKIKMTLLCLFHLPFRMSELHDSGVSAWRTSLPIWRVAAFMSGNITQLLSITCICLWLTFSLDTDLRHTNYHLLHLSSDYTTTYKQVWDLTTSPVNKYNNCGR